MRCTRELTGVEKARLTEHWLLGRDLGHDGFTERHGPGDCTVCDFVRGVAERHAADHKW